MTKQKSNLQQARVLGGFTLDGVIYRSDDIIEADPVIIKSLGTAVDADPGAVTYCLDRKEVVIRTHAPPLVAETQEHKETV